jgi:pimeloyl-ACP methyl ester carboxylesterase
MKKLLPAMIGAGLNTVSLIAPDKAGKFGFELFCRPFRGKLTSRHKEFLLSAGQFTLKYEGEQVQVYQWGAGPRKVLFLHGWQSHTYRWKNYIDALDKDRFTIYALDAPGHGLSTGSFLSVPLYSDVIKKLLTEIGSVDTIVSHSLGGFTAIYTAYHEPRLAPAKMVVMAPPGEAQEFFDFYAKTLKLSQRAVNLTIRHFEKVIGKPPTYFSVPSFAGQLTLPGLLIHDEEDDETSVENSKAIHRAWRNSQLIITKGKGHNLKSPELITETVEFINKQSIS